MPYVTLSEQLARLDDPQCSEHFLRLFRAHLQQRLVTAATLPARFEFPQTYTSRSGETYTRTMRDMVIESTPAFEAWFSAVAPTLEPEPTRLPRPEVTAKNIEAGLVDFELLATRTRKALIAAHKYGEKQKLLRAERRNATPTPERRRIRVNTPISPNPKPPKKTRKRA